MLLTGVTVNAQQHEPTRTEGSGKPVIYQVMTRLFGNDNLTNKPWGTIEENGVGKFADFTPEALAAIKSYGTTHLWYTGVPHHAVINDYTAFGISNDDPDVVKGRAGSPYAVKDYYSVNPDLAVEPAKRLEEFQALIQRTHAAGMKVIIDIVPNHVARDYVSLAKPEGTSDLGADDDTTLEYHRENNFYYIPGEAFKVPVLPEGLVALGGDDHPLADGKFDEVPAKWTGNGSRLAQPKHDDWFETVKVNYGVKPDGSYDFDRLPDGYDMLSTAAHFAYWQHRDVPGSWKKFRDICLYWLDMGVDGFRFDMAEMVPVEFWSYLNSTIKHHHPDSTLVAEVYNRDLYRDYLKLGRMDYLYDKVDLYDNLKWIMQGKQGASTLLPLIEQVSDIDNHMLNFLENHDEQRIASPEFAGNAMAAKPAMVISALLGRGATMLYFAQALGEAAAEDAGWGKASRTTIFDYWGLETIQRWRNGGSYDGGRLAEWQKELQSFYQTLLALSVNERAFAGKFEEIHTYNLAHSTAYSEQQFSFVRWHGDNSAIVLVNFSEQPKSTQLKIPRHLVKILGLTAETSMTDALRQGSYLVKSDDGDMRILVELPAYGSVVLR
jgi:glycosidase